ncbi:choline/glycine/proline betaine transport protein [Roseomonas rosea]|uniref:Choline/glycine/proline betaine transport protein n=1 Tax=Muricoccus roseus TaxID=198092 RepID=A0A1M6P0G0_9PROT|nr:choline BCCT transporter BetT [Roseomonas rosea]SHK01400.1 choline/glycine/proline betaine transport protein [Roseomonas rosea]
MPDTTPAAPSPQSNRPLGPVFIISATLIAAIALCGVIAPEAVGRVFNTAQGWILSRLGWFYLLSVAGFVFFVLYLALSSHGTVRLGPNHSEPDFSYGSWFAMLFSAGMGIGLVFFGVAEPVTHFTKPPVGDAATVEAAREAMRITFFHWGIHAWAIYAVVGLSLAYFGFRHGLPLTIRSALYPLIGERIHGPIGQAIDIFAVLGTVFGVATSLGLGVLQINAGLSHLTGLPSSTLVQIALIAAITGMATISVVMGLDAGIRRISEFNMVVAVVLLIFVAVVGPTVFLLQALVQNIGGYIDHFFERSFMLYAYEPNDWIAGWTLFYWAWWISWSPFVGMFIARISRGRTIREFVLGVLFVPTGFTFIWMTVFGNTAISLQLSGATTAVSEAVATSVPLALFAFLEQFPFATLSSALATLLVVTFFITSADSAALVIDTITAGGAEDAPVWRRVFWALISGLIAAVLLSAGGLQSLQTATIASALPFTFVMLVICYGLLKALRTEALRRSIQYASPARIAPEQGWQRQLHGILHHPSHAEVLRYLAEVATPALEAVCEELRRRGVDTAMRREEERVGLAAMAGTADEFRYGLRARGYALPSFAYFERGTHATARDRYFRAEVFLSEGGQDYDMMGQPREALIADVLAQYERHIAYRQAAGRVGV